jgi:hypothetical protein
VSLGCHFFICYSTLPFFAFFLIELKYFNLYRTICRRKKTDRADITGNVNLKMIAFTSFDCGENYFKGKRICRNEV